MKIERRQVEEVQIYYCIADLRRVLKYEDGDELRSIPDGAEMWLEDARVCVRFLAEREFSTDTDSNVVVGEPVEGKSDTPRPKYTIKDLVGELIDAAGGFNDVVQRARAIYELLGESAEPMTVRDIHAALKNGLTIVPTRRSMQMLEKLGAIEYCGLRYSRVRADGAHRKAPSWKIALQPKLETPQE